jgi:hypothetical protein
VGRITCFLEVQMPHPGKHQKFTSSQHKTCEIAASNTIYSSPYTKTNYKTSDFKCWVYEKPRYLTQCEEFLSMSPENRQGTVKKLNLCFNCLSTKHTINECRDDLSRTCQQKHITLLLMNPFSSTTNNETTSTKGIRAHVSATKSESGVSYINTSHQVLLGTTAIVCVLDGRGNSIKYRALLDSGSQASFITERLVQLLGAKNDSIHMPVFGINEKFTVIKHIRLTQLSGRSESQISQSFWISWCCQE